MLRQIQIDNLIKEIASGYHPEKIYLFGSYANDNATEDSDVDIFIIKNTNQRKTERSREARSCIKNYPVAGIDIIVYTPSELQEGMQEVVNIGKEAVTTGKLMYERI